MRQSTHLGWLLLALFTLIGCRGGEPTSSVVVGSPVPSHGGASTCADCHLGSYETSRFDHASVGYGHDCDTCHLENVWDPFNDPQHDRFFPLVGTHATMSCGDCHREGRADPQPTACVGCHQQDTVGADPDHSNFPVTCGDCHTSVSWEPASFDHERVFPLRGAHAGTDCGSCHVNGVYQGTPRDCVDCHTEDRERAVDPDHTAYPNTCNVCHSEISWRPADFDGHDEVWPLTGQHAQTDCSACHVDNRYVGTPRECVGCHQEDLNRVVEPDHSSFPRDCAECHSTVAWEPAAFDHDVFFRIEGAHTRAECNDCHINEVYAGTPRTCIGCHQIDRDQARPTHVRFSNTCTECHTQSAFTPATHRHRQFIVPHEGVRQCGDCHTDQNDYRNVGCTSCHEHSRGNTDGEHRGIRDYRYEDAACLDCHPQGRE